MFTLRLFVNRSSAVVNNLSSLRNIHIASVFSQCPTKKYMDERTFEEVKIPVPWGYIAGKWWGPQDRRPILALHGWQDNCGTFDRLIPLLPRDVGFLAIDAPGHGLSSRIPAGMFTHAVNLVLLIRMLMDYFKWPKISLMGHSMGAITSFSYATMFPESLDFLICLDGLKPFSNFPGTTIKKGAKAMDEFMRYDKLAHSGLEPPSYTYEEMQERLHAGSRKSVAMECTGYLLARAIAPSTSHPGTYYFTRDPRVKVANIVSMQHADILEHVRQVTCPVLVTKGTGSYIEKKEHFYEALDILKATSADCRFHYMQSTHHGHLNNPELFVDLITDFVTTYDVDDRTGGGIECLEQDAAHGAAKEVTTKSHL